MSAILPQILYRFILHKFKLDGRKVDFIENQHHFGKPLIFIRGLIRCCEGNDLLRHAVIQQREILRSKPRKWLPLTVRCSDIEMDKARRRTRSPASRMLQTIRRLALVNCEVSA